MSQAFFGFEQVVLDSEQADRDAKAAAKAAAVAAREAAKRQEEIDKSSRRRMRALEYKRRHETQWAKCGIRSYSRRTHSACYWTTCHDCGQPLRYFDTLDEAETYNREQGIDCKRPRSKAMAGLAPAPTPPTQIDAYDPNTDMICQPTHCECGAPYRKNGAYLHCTKNTEHWRFADCVGRPEHPRHTEFAAYRASIGHPID